MRDFEFLTYDEREAVATQTTDDSVVVKRDAFWSYCGPLLSPVIDAFPQDLHEWASTALCCPTGIPTSLFCFLRFVNDFVASKGIQHYWVTIRATTATDEYDRTRWHTDDLFFSSTNTSGGIRGGGGGGSDRAGGPKLDLQTDWKICATLLGPSTLFIPHEHQAKARRRQDKAKRARATDHLCTSIRCLGCAATADAVRDDLTASLAKLGVAQAPPGRCAHFRIGQEKGAVHSEPPTSQGGRIFVNVVPGSRDELSSLLSKWGMDFPRSWWVSPSVTK